MVKVTVLMSVYNGEKFLKEAIESILNQTYKEFEFIIIEDASTDLSLQIIKSFKDPRIRLYKNQQNLGLTRSLNKGIRLSRGEFIARMDDDDVSMGTRLEKQLKYISDHMECVVLATRVRTIDYQGNDTLPWETDKKILKSSEIAGYLPIDNCLAHSSVMFRKKEFGFYDERFKNSQDYAKWLDLTSEGKKIEKLDEDLIKYRVYFGNVTHKTGLSGKLAVNRIRYQFLLNKPGTVLTSFGKDVVKSLIRDEIDYVLIKSKSETLSILMRFLAKVGYFVGKVLRRSFNGQYVFVFPDSDLGGSEMVHIKILEIFKKYKPIVFITNQKGRGELYSKFLETGADIRDLSKVLRIGLFYCLFQGYLAALADNTKKSVLFGSNSSFFYRVVENILGSTRKIDLIHAFGNGIDDWGLPFTHYLDNRVVITKTMEDRMINEYEERGIDKKFVSKIVLIENVVDMPKKYLPKLAADRLKVLFVGRGLKEKRPEIALEVARRCYEKGLAAEFVFVGDFKQYFASDMLPKNVILRGVIIDRVKLNEIYNKSDILLLTSQREGFPLVVMEAMVHGVVPLCVGVGGVRDYIKDGSNGIVIADRDPKRIVNDFVLQIKKTLAKPNLREKMSQNAYDFIKLKNSPENFKRKYIQLFKTN